jgi:c(7)-type cytochrome triheme protein
VIGGRAILLVCALTQIVFAQNQAAKDPPAQPLPFSHKLHAGALKVPCKMCHPGPDPGEVMTLPEASKCMECHSAIKKDSPAIQKLAAYANTNREIDWVRIYQIPTYVIFSHKTHLDSGAKCQDCHGPVAERERLFRETDISMGGCMACHRAKNASIDCTTCHDQLR